MADTERRPIMAGNWKMHHTHLDAIQIVQKLSYRLEERDYDECEVVVCPAFTALRSVQTTIPPASGPAAHVETPEAVHLLYMWRSK